MQVKSKRAKRIRRAVKFSVERWLRTRKGTVPVSRTPDSPLAPSTVPTSSTSASKLVNINSATLAELTTLPGIGHSIAQRIIDFRNANGPFTVIKDVMKVSGISQAKFETIKDLITTG